MPSAAGMAALLHVETAGGRRPASTAYVPDIGGVLPLYVADKYAGFDARPFADLTDAEVERYIAANAAAVRDVVGGFRPDLALANHLVMGPVILARALGGRVPYAVKIHGSALEYTVRPDVARFGPYAREGLAGAAGVLAGSRHTAQSLWEVVGMPDLPARPGCSGRASTSAGSAPARRARPGCGCGRWPTGWRPTGPSGAGRPSRAGHAGRRPDPRPGRQLCREAHRGEGRGPADRGLAAGGGARSGRPPDDRRLRRLPAGAARLVRALGAGDLAAARAIAGRGREEEGGRAGELHYLAAFLDGLAGGGAGALPGRRGGGHAAGALRRADRARRRQRADERLAAVVVPSTFPEAFGMVLAEAACCGSVPLSADHSGLAEVTQVLAPAVPPDLRAQLSFQLGAGAVPQIAQKLSDWLSLADTDPEKWREAQLAMTAVAQAGFGWGQVATGVAEAARGAAGPAAADPSPLSTRPARLGHPGWPAGRAAHTAAAPAHPYRLHIVIDSNTYRLSG